MTRERAALAGKRFLPETLFLLLLLAVFADPLFFRRNFAGRDLLPYHLPTELQIHDAYAQGGLPLWSPQVSGGRPLLPNPNAGVLYPVRPLMSLLPFPVAFRIYPVLHWLAAGLGMMCLLRALGARVLPEGAAAGGTGAGAWVAAVSYTFSGVGMSEVFYTNIQPGMTLLPWIVWAAVRPAGGSLARRTLPIALLLALDLLAGDPFTIGNAVAACAAWILLETNRALRSREAGALALAAVLAGLAAAPQIVASALWAPLTNRAITGLPLKVAVSFSVSPLRLLELVVPYPFGSTSALDADGFWAWPVLRTFFSTLYCGALAVLAIPVLRQGTPDAADAQGRRRLVPGARLAFALIAGSVTICVLPWFLPAAWGESRSPIPLRYPEKFAVALAFGLALAAGLAAGALRRGARIPRGRFAVAAALAAVAVAARLAPAPAGRIAAAALGAGSGVVAADAGRQLSAAFSEAGLFWAATIVALDLLPRSARGALPAALLLLAAVPIAANRRIAKSFPQEELFRPPAFARLAARRDPGNQFRTLDASRYRPPSAVGVAALAADPAANAFYRRRWFLYTPALWNRGTVLNADPDVGDLSRMESLRKLSATFPAAENAGALFGSLSLRYAVRFRDQEPLPGYAPAAEGPLSGDRIQGFDEEASALPSIRVAARLREAAGPVEALAAIPEIGDGEIVAETGRTAAAAPAGGSIERVDDRGAKLSFLVSAPQPCWVFVLRGFWPYRTILVDGAPVEAVPAQLAFSAIPVPAGRHRVEWREELPGGAVSWWGPVAALAAAFFLKRRERTAVRVSRDAAA